MSAQEPFDSSEPSRNPVSSEPVTADMVDSPDAIGDSEVDTVSKNPKAPDDQGHSEEEKQAREESILYLKRIEWFTMDMASDEPRKVNWPLIWAQLFQPWKRNVVLMWAGLVLLSFLVPTVFDQLNGFWRKTPVITAEVNILILYAVLLFFLFYHFLKGFRTIRFLKRGKAATGHFFQVVEVKYARFITRQQIRYAYKADNGMIYTTAIEDSDYRKYASIPALSIFYLQEKPGEGIIYEKMFGTISYNTNFRLFSQSPWYWLSLGLPALPFLAFAIGLVVQRFYM